MGYSNNRHWLLMVPLELLWLPGFHECSQWWYIKRVSVPWHFTLTYVTNRILRFLNNGDNFETEHSLDCLLYCIRCVAVHLQDRSTRETHLSAILEQPFSLCGRLIWKQFCYIWNVIIFSHWKIGIMHNCYQACDFQRWQNYNVRIFVSYKRVIKVKHILRSKNTMVLRCMQPNNRRHSGFLWQSYSVASRFPRKGYIILFFDSYINC